MAATRGQVMTVLGPVAPDDLGPTLMHEHLLLDLTCYWVRPVGASMLAFADEPVGMGNLGLVKRNPQLNRDNCLLTDLDATIEEIGEFKRLGGGTIVDVTLPDIGRDPLALQIAARASGLNVVAGCGHYVFLAHPPGLDAEPVESIADRLVAEITDGIGATGVRPGIIGELGTSDPIRPNEEKVLRAAARAQQETGLAITIHNHPPARTGHQVLDILEDAGADLSRVVMGHLDLSLGHVDIDTKDAVDYHRSLAERGVFLEYDCCGNEMYFPDLSYGAAFFCPSDRERVKALALLVEAGYEGRILLSQDVCHKVHLMRYGGHGYGHVLRSFPSFFRDFGLPPSLLETFLVDNPLEVLPVQ